MKNVYASDLILLHQGVAWAVQHGSRRSTRMDSCHCLLLYRCVGCIQSHLPTHFCFLVSQCYRRPFSSFQPNILLHMIPFVFTIQRKTFGTTGLFLRFPFHSRPGFVNLDTPVLLPPQSPPSFLHPFSLNNIAISLHFPVYSPTFTQETLFLTNSIRMSFFYFSSYQPHLYATVI